MPCRPRWRHHGTVPDIVAFRLWPPIAIGLPLLVGLVLTRLWGDPVGLPAAATPVGMLLVVFFTIWERLVAVPLER